MKKLFLIATLVALTGCGGGSEPPDLSDWTQAVANSINFPRENIVYSDVTFTEDRVCGKATNLYNYKDYSFFWYNGSDVVWGEDALRKCGT